MKKKMIKEGLLDEKGKANERTPVDWQSKYKDFTHYGQQSSNGAEAGTQAPSAAVAAEAGDAAPLQEEGSEGLERKKKKKKRKKESSDDEDD